MGEKATKPENDDKLTKAATVLIKHMRENRDFLTHSEASTAFNAVKELRTQGYIVPGACAGGIYDGVDGFVVLPKRIKPPPKKEPVVAVVPKDNKCRTQPK